MDEQKLGELFRDAARDAPPPSFDVDAVRSASARASARRRSAVAVGSVMAVVLVFGGLVVGADLVRSTSGGELASAGSAQDASSPNVTPFTADEPEMVPKDASPDRSGEVSPESIPEDSSTQGDDPPGSAGRTSAGSAQRGCVEVDRELAVALADELPVANADDAFAPTAFCPGAVRGASLPVRDGDVGGTLSVVIAPGGTTGLLPDRSYAYASARTAGGDELFVISRSDVGADDPFQGELPGLASRLADRF
ncbi:hypothetical protein FHX81_4567 [Saccharothrix saharensis]|uniref:Uncharacterized protein n=1 Tax=Saccharothrix saharensis TaxID=571190 RepID=A0A543JH61_9PSEU|nr:hypothetical protein [Saccharothrix saharensis]TQM82170.1 hypothetical protein FHX81_4567 [Saccharothrix saharensis]